MKFKIIRRDNVECEHDTGVIHSRGYGCREVERLARKYHMFADDPLHEKYCHGGEMVE